MSNERVRASVLDDLYKMASTCAVKGKLLRELIDEIRDTRKLLEEARPALESGVAFLLQDAAEERSRSSRYDIGTEFFKKYDSRARISARDADLLNSLAGAL